MQKLIKQVIVYVIAIILLIAFFFQMYQLDSSSIVSYSIKDVLYLDNRIITAAASDNTLYILLQTTNLEEYILAKYQLPEVTLQNSVIVQRNSPHLKLYVFHNYILLIQYMADSPNPPKYAYFDADLTEHFISYSAKINHLQFFFYNDVLYLSVEEIVNNWTSYNSLLKVSATSSSLYIDRIRQFDHYSSMPIGIVVSTPTLLRFYFAPRTFGIAYTYIQYDLATSSCILNNYNYDPSNNLTSPEFTYFPISTTTLLHKTFDTGNYVITYGGSTVASFSLNTSLYSPTLSTINVVTVMLPKSVLFFPAAVRVMITSSSTPTVPLNTPLSIPLIAYNLTTQSLSFVEYFGNTHYYPGDFVDAVVSKRGIYILSNPNSDFGPAGQILPIEFKYKKVFPNNVFALQNPFSFVFSAFIIILFLIYRYRKRPPSPAPVNDLYPQA